MLDQDRHRAEVVTCYMDPKGPARVEILPFVGCVRRYERVTTASLRRLRDALCSRRGEVFLNKLGWMFVRTDIPRQKAERKATNIGRAKIGDDLMTNLSNAEEKGERPRWWPNCPYPQEIFPMTVEEYVKAIPDASLRTAISGMLARFGWEVASDMIFERYCQAYGVDSSQ